MAAEKQLTWTQLTGRNADHVVTVPGASSALIRLQPAVVAAFLRLQTAAASAGHNLHIASGFRDFERQRVIWTRKWQASTQDQQALETILHWSALPGASRHHWGTDADFFDPSALGTATLQLEPWEYEPGGPFASLSAWLTEHAARFGFYRCYADPASSGVAVEPWHFSFAPIAQRYPEQLNCAALRQLYLDSELPGHAIILPQLEQLLAKYVWQTTPAPAVALAAPLSEDL
ncbi:MAG: M15 family metallopeptidase [Aliidiomarina sp.]|uniref:M15 family metallopeptidase n=1 Tax=Aliidiomarina sp. TaxID=1872439 RepID=UPI0025BD3F72|nr:M15 family metallopeptidase [Aliidiomarina sp.]MCH8501991.1 M15 family metallopeptidase [Aliidiomarina sp.]